MEEEVMDNSLDESIICLGLIKVSCTGSEPYNKITGTSMAAPFVTGVAALIWSYCPDTCNATDIRHILKEVRMRNIL